MENGNENGQLEVHELGQHELPRAMWKSALGRAEIGFFAEVSDNQYFIDDAYVARLCEVENNMEKRLEKLLLFGFAFSVFSVLTANNRLGEAKYFGLRIADIPYLTEFCILVLGILVMTFVFAYLDILAVGAMRRRIFRQTGSEHPNMRMVHWKGNLAWIDALVPKVVGYSSGLLHKVIQWIALIWVLLLPIGLLGIFLGAQFICWYGSNGTGFDWISSAISIAGLVFSVSSVTMLVLVTAFPLRFSLAQKTLASSAGQTEKS